MVQAVPKPGSSSEKSNVGCAAPGDTTGRSGSAVKSLQTAKDWPTL